MTVLALSKLARQQQPRIPRPGQAPEGPKHPGNRSPAIPTQLLKSVRSGQQLEQLDRTNLFLLLLHMFPITVRRALLAATRGEATSTSLVSRWGNYSCLGYSCLGVIGEAGRCGLRLIGFTQSGSPDHAVRGPSQLPIAGLAEGGALSPPNPSPASLAPGKGTFFRRETTGARRREKRHQGYPHNSQQKEGLLLYSPSVQLCTAASPERYSTSNLFPGERLPLVRSSAPPQAQRPNYPRRSLPAFPRRCPWLSPSAGENKLASVTLRGNAPPRARPTALLPVPAVA